MDIQGKTLLGNMLLQAGKVDEDQLQNALTFQREKEGYIGQIFVDKGNIASDIKNPPKLTNRFESRVFWLSKKKIIFNKKYLMKINKGEYKI